MTDTPDTTEDWWDKSLTSAGRRDILQAAGVRLPSAVLWRHMRPEARAAVEARRPADTPPAPRLSPEETITQLRVEVELLRARLNLTARSLKDYLDSKHTKADAEGLLELTIPASVREKAATRLADALATLKQSETGRSA